MKPDREQEKAELADLIVAGIVRSDFTPDLSKLDADDVVMGLTGHDCDAMDARQRCNGRLVEQAAAWLESDPRGALMLDEALEKEAEFQDELAELHARDEAAA